MRFIILSVLYLRFVNNQCEGKDFSIIGTGSISKLTEVEDVHSIYRTQYIIEHSLSGKHPYLTFWNNVASVRVEFVSNEETMDIYLAIDGIKKDYLEKFFVIRHSDHFVVNENPKIKNLIDENEKVLTYSCIKENSKEPAWIVFSHICEIRRRNMGAKEYALGKLDSKLEVACNFNVPDLNVKPIDYSKICDKKIENASFFWPGGMIIDDPNKFTLYKNQKIGYICDDGYITETGKKISNATCLGEKLEYQPCIEKDREEYFYAAVIIYACVYAFVDIIIKIFILKRKKKDHDQNISSNDSEQSSDQRPSMSAPIDQNPIFYYV